ncbi:putative endopolygalacturonase D [Cytospora mali]|uniref:endo-polygalacturonase n=1 Tax=Cytospora mali TaxID=578113 RepID=A0A194UXQ6_CYTMA|nr:putative endopolygalacturonase D [Valsa mali var. pyri (nom. inval.)]
MRSFILAAAAVPAVLASCNKSGQSTLSTVVVPSAAASGSSPPYPYSDSAAPQVSIRPSGTAPKASIKPTGASSNVRSYYYSSASAFSSPAASAPVTTGIPTATSVAVTGNGGTTCTVTAAADVSSAVASCTNILLDNLSMPASSTLDMQALQPSAVVIFSGTTSFGYTPDEDFDPIVISGDYITVTGTADHVIDGNGQAYWDGKGSNGGTKKPDHFIVVKKTSHATFANLNIQNWPTHCFDMTGNEYLTVQDILLNNTAGDAPNSASGSKAAAHNSDGFDISSSDFVTLSSIKVYNQDDCVAVTSGTYITVSDLYCSGGHGLSIGSIGGKSNNTVDHVTFENSEVVNSQNGVRVKSNSGTTGNVTNILYRGITMSNISNYGLDIQQDYLNGGPTGDPTNGVNFSGFTFENVTGTVQDDADSFYILCGDGSCSDFTFTNVEITGGSESCNYPSTTCP